MKSRMGIEKVAEWACTCSRLLGGEVGVKIRPWQNFLENNR